MGFIVLLYLAFETKKWRFVRTDVEITKNLINIHEIKCGAENTNRR